MDAGDTKRIREDMERAAMVPQRDGQEPIPAWRSDGDGAFSVAFLGLGWGPVWSPDAARALCDALVGRWREETGAPTQGLPAARVHTGMSRSPGGYAPPRTFAAVEFDGQRVDCADGASALAEARRLLGDAMSARPSGPR